MTIKAQRNAFWFYSLEVERQVMKTSLESSLPLGLVASVTVTNAQGCLRVWASVPGFTVAFPGVNKSS